MAWLYLAAAIVSEVMGTLGLRGVANHFRLAPALLIGLAYVVSFSFLSVALRSVNVGAAYAIWSGVGTAAVAGLGVVFFGEDLSWRAVAGMAIIVAGVIVLVGSGSVRHG